MKVPKKIKTHCKHCKKHTLHIVSEVKVRERGSLKKGSIKRAMARGAAPKTGNKGKYGSKPAISKWKRTGAKSSKKHAFKLKCKECNKILLKTYKRSKKALLE